MDFIAHVNSYYVNPTEDSQIHDRSDAVPHQDIASNVDRPLLEQVWKWLIKDPDIRLGGHAGHQQLTLSEVEARNTAIEQSEQSVSASQEINLPKADAPSHASSAPPVIQDGNNTQIQQTTETASTKTNDVAIPQESKFNPGIRLYASENRMWHALTGHSPDFTKVKSLEFVCLSIIAACGSKGILQHDLVRISGQDKRSLPARTDRLRDGGYIEKRRVSVQLVNPTRWMHTSRCILKRFANGKSDQEQQVSDPDSAPVKKRKRRKRKGQRDQDSQAPGQSASTAAPQSVSGDIASSESRMIPSWTVDRPINNQIFELVDRAGIKGMSMTVRLHFLSLVASEMDSLTL